MQYQSPVKLLQSFAPNQKPEDLNIDLLKKKLLAEFELQRKVTIHTEAGELTKDGVIQMFDKLKNLDNLYYHLEIANDAALLNFLETSQITGSFLMHPLYRDEKFLKFITPYFAHSYNAMVTKFIGNYELCKISLDRVSLLIAEDEMNTALRPIKQKINNLTHEVKGIIEANEGKSHLMLERQITYIFNPRMVKLLNSLDPHLFESEITLLAETSLELTRIFLNKERNRFLHPQTVSLILAQVNSLKALSGDFKEKIKPYFAVLDATRHIEAAKTESANDSWSVWRFIRVIVAVVWVIILIGKCVSSGNKRSDYSSPTNNINIASLVEKTSVDDDDKAFRYLTTLCKLKLAIQGTENQQGEGQPVRTGQNPFPNLPVCMLDGSQKHHFSVVNHSNFDIAVMLNLKEGNLYAFVNQSDSMVVSTDSVSFKAAFLAGRDWDFNNEFPIIKGNNASLYGENIKISGFFKTSLSQNQSDLIRTRTFKLPELVEATNQSNSCASIVFTTDGSKAELSSVGFDEVIKK
jgi:hypothetical protein